MRTAVSRLELLEPHSLRDALRMMQDHLLAPLAGATDLYVAVNAGTLESTRFLNLWNLESLRRIRMDGEVLSIGALATYTAIIRSRLVRQRLPMLVSAAREIGGIQIQNRGTLGGNVANGSPAGDTLPVLAVADAAVVLRSLTEERRVPFADFYTGYRRNVRRPDELIVALEFPPIEGTQWFRKVGTRAAQAISKVVMAAVRAPHPRIALGSVAPTVIRLIRTETVLGRAGPPGSAGVPAGELMDAAVDALNQDIQPIDDLRSTARYRGNVAANLLRRFWADTAPVA